MTIKQIQNRSILFLLVSFPIAVFIVTTTSLVYAAPPPDNKGQPPANNGQAPASGGGCKTSNPPARDPNFSCGGASAGTSVSNKESSDGFYESSEFGCSGGTTDPGDNCVPGCEISGIPECNGKSGRA